MKNFKTFPKIKQIGKCKYELIEDYVIEAVELYTNKKTRITVPSGFVTDLMSVPKILDSIIPHDSKYCISAAVVHDFLYYTGGYYGTVTRKQADEIFKNMILSRGLGKVRASILYRAVRLFGGSHWVKNPSKPN